MLSIMIRKVLSYSYWNFVVLRVLLKLFKANTMNFEMLQCVILAFQGFEMQTFAASVFSKLRRLLDITEEEYINSLCSDACYLQFVSNSKSKADFFVT